MAAIDLSRLAIAFRKEGWGFADFFLGGKNPCHNPPRGCCLVTTWRTQPPRGLTRSLASLLRTGFDKVLL